MLGFDMKISTGSDDPETETAVERYLPSIGLLHGRVARPWQGGAR